MALYWSPPYLSTFVTRQRSVVSVSGHLDRRPASCSEARTVVVSLGTDRYVSTAYWAQTNASECPCPVPLVTTTRCQPVSTRHTTYSTVLRSHVRLLGSETSHPPIWSSAALGDTRPVQAMRLPNRRATTRSARMYDDGATCDLRCDLPIAHPSEHPAYTTQERRRCKSGK